MFLKKLQLCTAVTVSLIVSLHAQLVTDPLSYAPIANPLPDTMDQLYRDSLNIVFSPIRINQAGYRPQDEKYFYYIGSGASEFSVIDASGATVGSGILQATGQTSSSQLKIKASNNATLVSGGDTRYLMDSPVYSGSIYEGKIPDLPPGAYQVVVGTEKSHPFVIDERVYSWVRDALLKFYGVNRCGDSQSWFHPPCHLLDEVTGGWHDCGDHLKEGATMSYTAAVLGLAAAAFSDRDMDVYSANQGITQITDGIPDILYEAKHGADFVLQSYDNAGGEPGNMVTAIGGFGDNDEGDAAEDHSWWGRPEYQDKMPRARGGAPRPVRHAATSDYLSKYAANLAFVSKMYRPYDAEYADRCLEAAIKIFEFTAQRLDKTDTPAYNGAKEPPYDHVAFGCLALLYATEDRKYLEELCYDQNIGQSNIAFPKLFQGGWFTQTDPIFYHGRANTDWASVQAHVLWGFYRLVLRNDRMCTQLQITEKERDTLLERTAYNLIANLSSIGQGTQTIRTPETGVWVEGVFKYDLPWFTMGTQMEWVWNRYQSGNITEMYYYYDIASYLQGKELPYTPASAEWNAGPVKTVLVRMMDYMFGVNPWDISMVYGVGEKNYNHPHHRAANPEGKNVPGAFYRYIPPVGALQGGYMPSATGTSLYSEHFDDYFHSETGIDGTTNLLMPVIGLAKEDTIGAPGGNVRILYVGCDEAIIEVRQTRFGSAVVRYGTGPVPDKTKSSDSAGVLHRIVLDGLTQGTVYNFDVQVSDAFGRDSVLKYLDEDKNLTYFSFTTQQTCPTNAEISNVRVCRVTHDSAEIFWYTPNGEFDSKVVYGDQPPPTTEHSGDVAGVPVKFHYVKIGGLKEKTKYYFYVESGSSRDDNNGQLYTFTTPVEHVDFDVRAVMYEWEGMPTIGLNIMNQDIKRYDSLEMRLYVRGPETFTLTSGTFGRTSDTVVRFEDHVMFRVDIGIKYRSDGFQDKHFKTELDALVQGTKPVRIDDTYDPATKTWGYYIPVPMGGAFMESGARFRIDISLLPRSPFYPYEDSWPMERVLKEITDADWSFGSHSTAAGDPYDYDGVPVMTKESVDNDNFRTPINHYITVYRKDEYVWGYSPSQAEMKTKKNQYKLVTQVTDPLNNPSADYVYIFNTNRKVNISGWATIEPVDGMINDIWVNGVRQQNISSLYSWNDAEKRYDFTIPAMMQNGRNNVDVTIFAGPDVSCDECYGCAVSNHNFYVEFQGAKQYPSTLVLRDEADVPVSDTVRPDTTVFHVIVTDRNGNISGKAVDKINVTIKNVDNNDSMVAQLIETGDSTGVFKTAEPIMVVDRMPDQTTGRQIAMNGGDRVRIWYIDPTDEFDSSEAYIYSKATFPIARRGYLKDRNGDGSVDFAVVEYSTALEANPDSVRVHFPTSAESRLHLAAVGDAMSITGNILQITPSTPYKNGITGFSSAIYSTGVSYLLKNNMVRMSEFRVYDSIGPVLNGDVQVFERENAGLDTITVTLSEGYRFADIQGPMLLLRRAGVDYPVEAIAVLDAPAGTNQLTVLVDAGGQKFTAGDSLWLNSASAFTDLAGNSPHPDNRRVPVYIKAALPTITEAMYMDTDFNGVIDAAVIRFSKPVTPEDVTISVSWKNGTPLIISSNEIIASGQNEFSLSLPGGLTDDLIATGGYMNCSAVFSSSPLDTVTSDVADKAAPVIASAVFHLASSESNEGRYLDTLVLTLSETIQQAETLTELELFSVAAGRSYIYHVDGVVGFNLSTVQLAGWVEGVEYPQSGDQVWLPVGNGIDDLRGNVQSSADNRRVPVVVSDVMFSLKNVTIKKAPNPFNPIIGERFTVFVEPISRFPMPLDSSALASVYDKVGNCVKKIYAVKTLKGFELQWDGTNEYGRFVGSGTYLMMFAFKGEKIEIMVGVVNN